MSDVFPGALLSPRDNPTRQPPPLRVIPDRWYAVLPSRDLGSPPVAVRRMGEDLVLYRTPSGAPHAAINRCPHRGVPLSLGRVVGDDLQCPYHGFRFAPDGACTRIPCDGPDAVAPPQLKTTPFPCREAHGLIWVWWGRPMAPEALPEVPWLPEVGDIGRVSVGRSQIWPFPAHRAIEGWFDAHHAPIVHGRGPLATLGRFDNIAVRTDGDRVELTGTLRRDGSSRAIAVAATFVQPCVSYFRLGDFLQIVSIDVPIDGATTWRHTLHISPVKTPLPALTKLFARTQRFVGMTVIQDPEDLRLVSAAAHRAPGLFEDVYVSADAGCVAVGEQRRDLLDRAAQQAQAYPPHVRARLDGSVPTPGAPFDASGHPRPGLGTLIWTIVASSLAVFVPAVFGVVDESWYRILALTLFPSVLVARAFGRSRGRSVLALGVGILGGAVSVAGAAPTLAIGQALLGIGGGLTLGGSVALAPRLAPPRRRRRVRIPLVVGFVAIAVILYATVTALDLDLDLAWPWPLAILVAPPWAVAAALVGRLPRRLDAAAEGWISR